jgi:hypothetical protein
VDSLLKDLGPFAAGVEQLLAQLEDVRAHCKQLDAREVLQTFNELRARRLSAVQVIERMKNEAHQDAKAFIEAAAYLRASLDVVMGDLTERAAAMGVVLPRSDRVEDA